MGRALSVADDILLLHQPAGSQECPVRAQGKQQPPHPASLGAADAHPQSRSAGTHRLCLHSNVNTASVTHTNHPAARPICCQQPRQRLDMYIPKSVSQGDALPTVIFVTGGAWTIGYKAWGALLGRRLCDAGVITMCLDYRNFPQVCSRCRGATSTTHAACSPAPCIDSSGETQQLPACVPRLHSPACAQPLSSLTS
jgi:hypothetical protein